MRTGMKIVLVLGVLLALVLGGLAYADHRATRFAEAEAVQRVSQALPGANDVAVTIDSWPLIVGVLTGRIEQITVTADHVLHQAVLADDLHLEVHGVALDTDALFSDQRLVISGIERAALTGSMSQEAASLAAGVPIEFFSGMVKGKTPQGEVFVATLAVEDRMVRLIAPLPGVPDVTFALPSKDVVPCEPEVEVLEGKLSLRCEVHELPALVRDAMDH